jgi:hypothetical protein
MCLQLQIIGLTNKSGGIASITEITQTAIICTCFTMILIGDNRTA